MLHTPYSLESESNVFWLRSVLVARKQEQRSCLSPLLSPGALCTVEHSSRYREKLRIYPKDAFDRAPSALSSRLSAYLTPGSINTAQQLCLENVASGRQELQYDACTAANRTTITGKDRLTAADAPRLRDLLVVAVGRSSKGNRCERGLGRRD